MSDFKRVSLGYEVRRAGSEFVGGFNDERRPIGIVVERFTHPWPEFPSAAYDARETDPAAAAAMAQHHAQRSLIDGLPAQIKVYWQDTQACEQLMETDVEPNYPGGGCYRAWDREFPLLAVETGGYGDLSVLTPNGEVGVFVMEKYPDTVEGFNEYVLRAVRQYLERVPADEHTDAAV